MQQDKRYSIRKIGSFVTSLAVASCVLGANQLGVQAQENDEPKTDGSIEMKEKTVADQLGEAEVQEKLAKVHLDQSQADYQLAQIEKDRVADGLENAQSESVRTQNELDLELTSLRNQAEEGLKSAKDQLEKDEQAVRDSEELKNKAQNELDSAKLANDAAQNEWKKALEDQPEAERQLQAKDEQVAKEKSKKDQAQVAYNQAKEAYNKAEGDLKEAEVNKAQHLDELQNAEEDLIAQEAALVSADQAVADAQNKLDSLGEGSPAYQEAKIALEKAQEELNQAQADLELAKKTREKATESVSQAQESLDNQKREHANYLQSKENLEEQLSEEKAEANKQKRIIDENQKIIDQAPSNEELLNQEINQAKIDQSVANQAVKTAETNRNQAENEKQVADNAFLKAEEKVKKAQQKVTGPVTQAEKQAAQSQWDKGSLGFFEYNESIEAQEVFTKDGIKHANASTTQEEYDRYLKDTLEAGENDARNLDNMRLSIEGIKTINEKRQKDGGIDGRKLSVLKISDFNMAVAQANANYSQNKRDHASVFLPPYENLAWGSEDPSRALKLWWDDEKPLFDYLRNQIGLTSRIQMDKYIADHRSEINEKFKGTAVGHYTNLVDDLMWTHGFTDDDSKTAGYAFRPGEYFGSVSSMNLSPDEVGISYSINEYSKRFNDYYNMLKGLINGVRVPSQQDLDNLAQANEELRLAKATVEQAQSKLDQANTQLRLAQTDQSNKTNTVTNLTIKLQAMKQSVENARINVSNAETSLKTSEDKQTKINDQINNLVNENADKEQKIQSAEVTLDSAKKSAQQADKAVQSAEEAVEERLSAKDQANAKFSDLGETFKLVNDELNQAKVNREEAQSRRDSALENKKIAQSKLLQASNEITNKSTVKEQAQLALNQAKDRLVEATTDLTNEVNSQKVLKEKFKDYLTVKKNQQEMESRLKQAEESLAQAQAQLLSAQKALKETQNSLKQAQQRYDEVFSIDLTDPATFVNNFPTLKTLVDAYKDAQVAVSKAKEDLDSAEKNLARAKSTFLIAQADYQANTRNLEQIQKVYLASLSNPKISQNSVKNNNHENQTINRASSLPQTGSINSSPIYYGAALSILIALGLVVPKKQGDKE
ncbi:hypothetical protein [Facklamia hominis]|uniref:hypothetical protein n=1 Tax=Facklamia hominis TaxID=178214 RepID=UPI000353EC56|nr:hypothetical protein [Facklamia hominis]EPH10805.1 hypothetical protein HMPREF9260_01007 [Facklamia hominis ACS-120-V-Sch10]